MSAGGNSRFLQTMIYSRKFFRTLKKEALISIVIGIVITVLIMIVTEKEFFEYYESTKSGFFSLVCVCIWIGIFNSIQLVCREKNDIVKDELDKSLHASSYMAAHYIFQFVLCFIQSIIVLTIFYIYVHDNTYFEGSIAAYFITIYLLIFSSDSLAFVLSSAAPTSIAAMTVMPLVLMVQLVMAGVLFKLEGFFDFISYFTISKWGMSAFGMICNMCESGLPSPYSQFGVFQHTQEDLDSYQGDGGDVATSLFILAIFSFAFFVISVIALKLTTKKLKK